MSVQCGMFGVKRRIVDVEGSTLNGWRRGFSVEWLASRVRRWIVDVESLTSNDNTLKNKLRNLCREKLINTATNWGEIHSDSDSDAVSGRLWRTCGLGWTRDPKGACSHKS